MCGMNTKTKLKPTLWRTYRVLANEDRLRLFKAVLKNSGNLSVRDYAKMLNLADNVASVYLRQMNARGLLGVERSYIKVFYNLNQDRSLPKSIELQETMKEYLSGELTDGWEDELVRIFKAFTHFNRLAMLIRLSEGPATLHDLNRAAGIIVKSSYHHLRFLCGAGLIEIKREWHHPDVYSLKPPTNPIAKLLIKQTLEDAANGERHFNQTAKKIDRESKAILRKIRKEENVTRDNLMQRRGTGVAKHRLSKSAQAEMET